MRTDLPNDKASNFSNRVRETLMTYLGKQGDPLDRGLTLRDLVENGLATWSGGKVGSGTVPLQPGSAITAPATDLTPPPSPTNFIASAGISTFIAQHDTPTYTQGGGHLRTHLYGKIRNAGDPAPVFADAVEIAQFTGAIYAHSTNPSTTWHLWAKWETKAGVLSASPAGGTNGVVITTGQDVALLLTALSGQITSTQLYSALRNRIDLIDGDATLSGSVNARLAAEASARATAITGATTPISNALNQEISDRAAAITAEAATRTSSINSAVSGLQSQIDALSAASSGDVGSLIAVINSEQQIRKSADEAFAAQATLFLTMNAGNTAAIKSEEVARSTVDSATASSLSLLYAASGSNQAAILNEVAARVTQEGVFANQLSAVKATSDAGVAGLSVERSVSSSENAALAAQFTALSSTVGAATAALTQEQTTRATADSASASLATGLASTISANSAALSVEADTRASLGYTLSSQVTTLTALNGTSSAGLAQEISARSDATSALSSQVDRLRSETATGTAGLAQEQQARVSDNLAIASSLTTLAATHGANTASIQQEASARATDTGSLSVLIDRVRADTAAGTAALYVEQTTRVTDAASTASQIVGLAASFGSSVSAINNEATVRASADSTTASVITALTVAAGNSAAGLTQERTTSAGENSALASTINSLTAASGANSAAILSEASARATDTTAISNYLTTIQSSVNSNTVAISTEATTRANADNSLFAQYTVKIDAAGRVAGFGLASESTTAGVNTSAFGVNADRFWVSAPADFSQETQPASIAGNDGKVWYKPSTKQTFRYNSATTTWVAFEPIIPFAVQATATTINGVSVPAGIYMDAAFIKDGTITNAKIGDAAIDNAKIANLDAAKITTGFLSADRIQTGTLDAKIASIDAAVIGTGTINVARIGDASINSAKIADTLQSNNFVAGSAGWQINKSGSAFFNDLTMRGVLNGGAFTGYAWPANNGTGVHLGPNGLLAGNFNTGKWVEINANGNLSAPGFNITNGVATFSGVVAGNVTVTSGQVTGLLIKTLMVPASYSGIRYTISNGNVGIAPSSPWSVNGNPRRLFLLWYGTFPAPETVAHKIAFSFYVTATNNRGSSAGDLDVRAYVFNSVDWGTQTASGEELGVANNASPFSQSVGISGGTANTYSTEKTVAVFVTGYQSDNTVGNYGGLFWGAR